MTVLDKTATTQASSNLRFYITSTTKSDVSHPRFAYTYWTGSSDDRVSWITDGNYDFSGKKSDFYGTDDKENRKEKAQESQRSYVPKTTFTIVPAIPVPVIQPETGISANSATINWTAATGADSYEVRYGTTSGSLGTATNIGNVTSYTLDELEDETTYYYQVRTKIGSAYSAWTDEASFTTLAEAPHTHNGITFSKWNSETSMPPSGNYYLANDVELSANASISENLNLCLNGHNILTSSHCIIVPDGVTLAIYDNEGSGVIRGAYPGGFTESGLISIKDGGTLNISEGGVVNLADNANDYNLAIDNKGTLILSGAPTISGVKADIYLGTGKVITINGALTNSTPYSVNAVGQVITSGWATNMSGKTPGNYFASAKSGYSGVVISASEVKLVPAVVLSETDNTEAFADRISEKTGTETYVSLTRSLTSAQYNTFCLPFALTEEQMQEVFGKGYDLEELTSSSLNDDLLNMEFTKRTDLAAGKPYLLQPAVDVENPTFEGVTITETEALSSETNYIDFKAIYSPTLLTDGDESLLFLGADNTLFSPAGSTGPMKGFRGYFKTKNGVKANAIRAHITKKTGSTTGTGDLKTDGQQRTKVLRNGQLLIIRGENTYNAQGQLIK
ncbi:MAG: fibronectin type III domain-containing protein [Paludibacteraceae bacterium]|nr:fibronectin type III domain-containing protein [Paludibacteraceae bacterium]